MKKCVKLAGCIELIRGSVCWLLGKDTAAYRSVYAAVEMLGVVRKEGIRKYAVLKRLQRGGVGFASEERIVLRSLRFPIYVRPGTADTDAVINSVIREEYGWFRTKTEPRWMIDAGAYIGDTAAYFLSRFPTLKVVALEPFPSSFAMASKNLKDYGERIELLQKALWSEDRHVRFGGASTGASVQSEGFGVDGISMPSLLKEFSIPHLDILKMDIEGGEDAIFASDPQEWLKSVELLIMEIHGSSILELVSKVLRRNGFGMRKYRSVWYCERRA